MSSCCRSFVVPLSPEGALLLRTVQLPRARHPLGHHRTSANILGTWLFAVRPLSWRRIHGPERGSVLLSVEEETGKDKATADQASSRADMVVGKNSRQAALLEGAVAKRVARWLEAFHHQKGLISLLVCRIPLRETPTGCTPGPFDCLTI